MCIRDRKSGIVCFYADNGKYGSGHIACENADDEGDKLHHFVAVYGAKNNGEKGDKSANECNIRACGRYFWGSNMRTLRSNSSLCMVFSS